MVKKDWRTEVRSLHIIPLAVILAVAAVMIFRLAGSNGANVPLSWPGLLWIISLMVLVIVLDRALASDTQNGVLEALLAGPMTPVQYLTGKLLFAGSILLGLQVLILLLLNQMLQIPIKTPWTIIAADLLITDLGLLLIGLACSLIALLSRQRTAMLASILWPLSVPLIFLAIWALEAPCGPERENWWLILAGFDIVLLGFWPGLLRLIVGK
jgi:ABC-type transport system involved in cytochrome c biogenesis permease component